MRLTWRDAVGTLLVTAAVSITLAVANGWNWPLLGDASAGVIAMFLISYPSCLVAQAPQRMARAIRQETAWSSYVVFATVLGVVAVGLIIAGLIMNSVTVLAYLTAVVVAIWVVTTVDHVLEGAPTVPSPVTQ